MVKAYNLGVHTYVKCIVIMHVRYSYGRMIITYSGIIEVISQL